MVVYMCILSPYAIIIYIYIRNQVRPITICIYTCWINGRKKPLRFPSLCLDLLLVSNSKYHVLMYIARANTYGCIYVHTKPVCYNHIHISVYEYV